MASYQDTILSYSPVAYWRMDDTSGSTMTDSSGNGYNGSYVNTPTLNSTSLLNIDPGNPSVAFNGTNEYATRAHNVAFNATQFTVLAWIKADSLPSADWTTIMQKSSTQFDYDGWGMRITPSGAVGMTVHQGGVDKTTYSSGGRVKVGGTYFIAWVVSSTGLRVYIDGVQRANNATYSGNADTNSGGIVIGFAGTGPADPYFHGTIDELTFIGSALSEANIQSIYEIGIRPFVGKVNYSNVLLENSAFYRTYYDIVLKDRPVNYWRLKDSGIQLDEVGSLNLTPVNLPEYRQDPILVRPDDKINGSVYLNAAQNEYMYNSVANYRSSDSSGTIEAWLTTPTTSSGRMCIFACSDTAGSARLGVSVIATKNDGRVIIQSWNSTTFDTVMISNFRATELGKTYHFVFTSTGDEYELYINGKKEPLFVNTGSNNGVWFGDFGLSTNYISIGVEDNAAGYFYYLTGHIGEVAIYDYPFTPEQARDHYIAGSTLAFEDSNDFSIIGDPGEKYYLPLIEEYSNAYFNSKDYRSAVLVSGPVNYWPGETSGTTLLDIVGSDDLTLTNGPTEDIAIVKTTDDSSILYDSTSSHYSTASVSNYRGSDQAGTVEFWAKGDARFGTARTDASSNYFNFLVTGTKLTIQHDGNGGTFNDHNVTFDKLDNDLKHVVFQSTGTEYKIWLNGVEQKVNTDSGTNNGFWFADQTNRNNIYTAALVRDTISEYYSGNQDELAVYDRLLTRDEIIEHYQIGVQEFGESLTLVTEPEPDPKKLYAVVYPADRATPTAEQVLTGKDGWNDYALQKVNKPISILNNGADTFRIENLTVNTAYRAAYCWTDKIGISNVEETTAFPDEYEAAVKSLSPVAYWRLNEDRPNIDGALGFTFDGTSGDTTATDWYTNKSSTWSGNARLTNTFQKFGTTCAFFDGDGDYITIPTDSAWDIADGNGRTIEFWVRLTDLPSADWYGLISIWSGGTGWRLLVGTTGTIHLSLQTAGGDISSAGVMVAEEWQHVALVIGTDNVADCYVNGTNVFTVTTAMSYTFSGNTLKIGTNESSTWELKGRMDDLSITYGVKYTGNFTPPTEPVVKGPVIDETGNYPLVALNTPYSTTGILPYTPRNSLLFTSASQQTCQFDYANFRSSDNTGSIEFWARPGGNYVFSCADTASDSGDILSVLWQSSKWQLFIASNGATRVHVGETAANFPNNNTYHVVLTSNGTTWTMYVNGVSESLTYTTDTGTKGNWFADLTGTDAIAIGSYWRASKAGYWNGNIQELAIYNSALSASQVEQHYLVGLKDRTYERLIRLEEPVNYWKFDEGSGSTATDEIGSDNLTYQGSPTLGEPSLILEEGTAVTFNGTNQYASASIANFRGSDTQGSIEAWYRSTSSTYGTILCSGSSGNLALDFAVSADGELRIGENFDAGQWDTVEVQTVNVNDGGAHHLVATSDGSAWKLYIDGVEMPLVVVSGTNTGSWFGDNATLETLSIGARERTSVDGWMNGTLDEVAVYDVALTADQVLTHYKKGRYG